jgi:hypothetical protein
MNINTLDVLNERKMSRIPPHFSKTKITDFEISSKLEDWVVGHCKGRFGFSKPYEIGDQGRLNTSWYIGFENEKELTYFMLACPFLRR